MVEFLQFQEMVLDHTIEGRKFDLDKDILVQGNNVYGPDTYSLVTHYVSVRILGKTKQIGEYDSPDEAGKSLLLYRMELINKFAKRNKYKIPYKVYKAMMRWDIEVAG